MGVLIHLFVGLHIIGIASLLGGFLTQMKAMGKGTARFVPAMLHGALTMLVTGVILVGLNQADGHHEHRPPHPEHSYQGAFGVQRVLDVCAAGPGAGPG